MADTPIIPFREEAEHLVSSGTVLERLVDGCSFTEGPLYDAAQDRVLFTDIPGNRVLAWSAVGGLETFTARSHFAIGLYRDGEGRLLACEHSTRRLVRYRREPASPKVVPEVDVLARSWNGYALNSPNDVVYRESDDAVYFTDPPFGVCLEDGAIQGYRQAMEYGFCGVFRVGADPDAPQLIARSIYRPNGLCFSASEDRLYVSDSSERYHAVFYLPVVREEVRDEPVHFATVERGVPDGMRVDSEDRLYVATGEGVQVYHRDGTLLALIPVPEMVTNLCFGGIDRRDFYITAVSSLYRIRLNAQGVQR